MLTHMYVCVCPFVYICINVCINKQTNEKPHLFVDIYQFPLWVHSSIWIQVDSYKTTIKYSFVNPFPADSFPQTSEQAENVEWSLKMPCALLNKVFGWAKATWTLT